MRWRGNCWHFLYEPLNVLLIMRLHSSVCLTFHSYFIDSAPSGLLLVNIPNSILVSAGMSCAIWFQQVPLIKSLARNRLRLKPHFEKVVQWSRLISRTFEKQILDQALTHRRSYTLFHFIITCTNELHLIEAIPVFIKS